MLLIVKLIFFSDYGPNFQLYVECWSDLEMSDNIQSRLII